MMRMTGRIWSTSRMRRSRSRRKCMIGNMRKPENSRKIEPEHLQC